MRKLNIGCGVYKQDGYVNIDINPRLCPDLVRDIRKGLPYDDHSVDEILISHCLEHLTGEEIVDFVAEAWRVLKPHCAMVVVVPLHDPYDLGHKTVFDECMLDQLAVEGSTDYFQRTWRWEITNRRKWQDRRRQTWNMELVLKAIPM